MMIRRLSAALRSIGLSAVMVLPLSAAAQGLAERRVIANLPALEARIEAARQALRTPALAVGIVTSRGLVHFRGFGSKDGAGGPPPDAATVFRVGSTTKAYIGALLGMQVDRGSLSWSDRVTVLDPDFQMADPRVTADFQVIDLLAQRSGLPSYALGYLMLLNYPVSATVKGIRFVQPVAPFRGAFAYQNAFHAVAGRIVAARAGVPDWPDLLARDLLIPLGMFNASAGQMAFQENPNRATGYEIDAYSGRNQPVRTDYSPIGDRFDSQAAGGINGSVADVARWVQLQLGRGTVDGRQYLRPDTIEATWRPLVPVSDTGGLLPGARVGYATGWVVEQRADARLIWHNGGLDGFKSEVAFLPDHDLGIIVLSTLSDSQATAIVVRYALDYALDQAPQDLLPGGIKALDTFIASQRAMTARPAGARPMGPAADYTGLYVDGAGGPARVEVQGDGLRVAPLEARAAIHLAPWDGDRFQVFLDLPPQSGHRLQPLTFIEFERDAAGVAAFSFVDFGDPTMRFVKRRQERN